ncbi:uncharacterized protein LOC131616387 isoform X1 [Vicia villosa]|uniref:uncharacterized protein LOC131616387 isoform X1 n=1 Tax=Vicia villosa TaxID=3911 RepID=UPI00273C1024|nr:uncharacterized protein LOC131616387 isoform X1 [Vicia villosa]
MAPKRRPVKRGESRMDAALDAMAPFGFSRKLVRRTVDQLLEVYGGNEGWVFIEDAAYTLLINTLLEHQQDQDSLIEDNPENGPNEALTAGCSNGTLLLPCSNTEASDDAPIANQVVGTISAASETGNYLPLSVDTPTAASKAVIGLPITGDTSAAASRPNNQLSIMAVDTATASGRAAIKRPIKPADTSAATSQRNSHLPMTVDTATATSKTVSRIPIKPLNTSATEHKPSNQHSIKVVDTVSTSNEINNQGSIKAIIDTVSADKEYEPPKTKSSQPIGKLYHKRRRPCHGWISSDDEEEDLIELPA